MKFKSFKIGRATLRPGNPLIMGVLNVTPDSFSDGGRFSSLSKALEHAARLEEEGADIIDVGGESTRPGAAIVPVKTEIKRVLPVIEGIKKKSTIPISIDTRNPQTAQAAILAGADMINDVSGFTNPEMAAVAAKYKKPAVVMHMKGAPKTMQKKPRYSDVFAEVSGFLSAQANLLKKQGIDKIIVDPGIGFGKTLSHNLELLNRVGELAELGLPVMVGASRKSFIGAISEAKAENRLAGTLSAHLWGALNGAAILRVHDVAEHRQALDVLAGIIGGFPKM